MRAQLTASSAYFARMELAVDLEDILGVTVTEADLDAMTKPGDLVQFFSDRLKGQISVTRIESHVIAALTRIRRMPTDASDIQRHFGDLFSAE